VDGTGSGSCPVAGFGVSGVEPSGSSIGELKLLELINADCRLIEKLLIGFSIFVRYCGKHGGYGGQVRRIHSWEPIIRL
jgi:hypothetical protein